MDFAESVKAEKERVEQEAQNYKDKANLPGFWVMPVDDISVFIVLEEEIRDKNFGEGMRKIFAIEVEGERKDWALNPRNPLYSEVVLKLSEGCRVFKVLRKGDKGETRYTLKDATKLEVKPVSTDPVSKEVVVEEKGQ